MCGIIGAVTNVDVSPVLIEGLRKLEYRGYDSAGIATISETGALQCVRREGKLVRLEQELAANPISGLAGIGHTRWATHGRPTAANAHPHCTEKVAVVHNGIIENFRELRARLKAQGRTLTSETDSEVIPHLITHYLEQGMSPEVAVRMTVLQLTGAFAVAILFTGQKQFMIATRRGSPLVVGHGQGQMYVGSDVLAFAHFTSRVSALEDGDIAHITGSHIAIWDKNAHRVERPIRELPLGSSRLDRGSHPHYMLKEIHEQPATLETSLRHYIDLRSEAVRLPLFPFNLADLWPMTIVGCGTSYYAGKIGKYWFEKYARLPTALDIASEFRYRDAPLTEGGLSLFISQSGETADTLAALRYAKEHNQHVISLVNAAQSSMAKEGDLALPLLAGPEIGVASTKAFTAQLMALASLTLAFADAKNTLHPRRRAELVAALKKVPELVRKVLTCSKDMEMLAHNLLGARDVLFLGRGACWAVALEGALKFKELTYIHAEGVAAGELKHGPLALVDETVPIIALAPSDDLFEKTCSNIQEVMARGGQIIAFTDAKGAAHLRESAAHIIVLPDCDPIAVPFVYSVALQLLAYHTAVLLGNDVDQPRNLAKSVTVE